MKRLLIVLFILFLGAIISTENVFSAVFVDSLDISGQEADFRDLIFNTDGTKLFVIGLDGDDINEYVCTTGFDVSTCTYSGDGERLSVAGQEDFPSDLTFNTDGTKLFVSGETGDDINEYACTTGFDVSTCTYSGDGERLSVAGQEGTVTGITFNTDGTKLFVIGLDGDDINEYACTTGFDVSTCTYSGDGERLSVAAQDSTPTDLKFNTDGTKLFVIGVINDNVNEYACTTGFDVSTCTYSGDGERFSVTTQAATPEGLVFSSNGLKLFVGGGTSDSIHEYTLGTAFDVSSIPTTTTTTTSINSSRDNTAPTMGASSAGQKLIDDGFAYNNQVVDVENFKTHYPLVRTPVGQPNTLDLKILENQGTNQIWFVSVHFGVPQIHAQGEAIVTYYPGIDKMKIHDPNNLLGDIKIELNPVKCKANSEKESCVNVSLDHTFNEAPLNDMIRVTLADKTRNHADVFFNDGVEVYGDSLNPPNTAQIAAHGSDRGLLQLTQTDRAQEIWIDQHDRIWTKNTIGSFIMKPLDDFTHPDDNPVSENGYKRQHMHFDSYKSGQELYAKQIWNADLIQSQLPESFQTPAYGFILGDDNTGLKINDPTLQAEIIHQIQLAEQKWDSQLIKKSLENYVIIEVDEVSSQKENNQLQEDKITQVIIAQELLDELYELKVIEQTNELPFRIAVDYVPNGKIKENSSYIDDVRWAEFEKAKKILDEQYDPTRFFKYN